MRAIGALVLLLATALGALATPPGFDSPDPLAAVDRNRAAIVDEYRRRLHRRAEAR